ncbi:MAG: hypothetical protein H7A23_17175 [Leptospiraceae bacterium]|nr:hypothetical protein [Leptospiraceae bacterium]MCP5496280.1 hypothetical protein [Leptospiraceae bacterium]
MSQVLFCQEKNSEFFGDTFYQKKQYDLAILEYEKTKLLQANESVRDNLNSKLALSKMRQSKFEDSLDYILDSKTFTGTYLRIFASMKSEYDKIYTPDLLEVEKSNTFSELQKDRTKLLAGTVLLENRKFKKAKEFYNQLSLKSKDEEIQNLSKDVAAYTEKYNQLSHKSPYLAGLFSAILPGSGQIYARHDVDGILAFFFNTLFIGSSVYMYRLESKANEGHFVSGFMGFMGFTFYAANIFGAVSSANRYNLYQERQFYKKIRDKFFNIDTMERYSEVKFNVRF